MTSCFVSSLLVDIISNITISGLYRMLFFFVWAQVSLETVFKLTSLFFTSIPTHASFSIPVILFVTICATVHFVAIQLAFSIRRILLVAP